MWSKQGGRDWQAVSGSRGWAGTEWAQRCVYRVDNGVRAAQLCTSGAGHKQAAQGSGFKNQGPGLRGVTSLNIRLK